MNRRRKWTVMEKLTVLEELTVLAVVVVFLLAATVGCTHRRNAPHGSPQPARATITPSPYPHPWETKR